MEEERRYLKRSCGLGSDEVDLDPSCLVLSCCRSDQIRSDLSFQSGSGRQWRGIEVAWASERVVSGRCWPVIDPLFVNAFSKEP